MDFRILFNIFLFDHKWMRMLEGLKSPLLFFGLKDNLFWFLKKRTKQDQMHLDLWPREKTMQYHKRPYKTMQGHTRPQYVAQGHARSYKATDGRENIKQWFCHFELVTFCSIWSNFHCEHFLLMIPRFQQEQQQSFF